MRGGVFIKIYDEPLSPKEGACFKIYGERLSPTAGACLRYMKTYGPSLRRVQVPYIEAQKTIKNAQKKPRPPGLHVQCSQVAREARTASGSQVLVASPQQNFRV